MTGKSRVGITVLRRLSSEEIFGDNPPLGKKVEVCPVFEVGQEFVVGEDGEMPKGFCHWAWNDLYKVVTALRYGVNWDLGAKDKGAPTIHCCTDGLRQLYSNSSVFKRCNVMHVTWATRAGQTSKENTASTAERE